MSDDVRHRLRASGVTWRALGEQIVVLDLESSEYLAVSGAGTEIWPQLLDGASLDELVATLLEAYEIDEPTARADASAFVDDLRARKLLR